jgi:hypothetical protein
MIAYNYLTSSHSGLAGTTKGRKRGAILALHLRAFPERLEATYKVAHSG